MASDLRASTAGLKRGLFVTGTDTGVGKTVTACALVRVLCRRGLDVGVIKPVETGVGASGPLDAIALRDAAGRVDRLDDVCPQRFAMPAAPNVAAAAEGRTVDLTAIREAYARLASRHAFLVAEGAGGLLVPVADGLTMADMARDMGLPLVVVARAALGTINHTLLTLEAAAARNLRLAGVVISHSGGLLSAADQANLDVLRRTLGKKLAGEIPPLPAGSTPAEDAIDVDALLERSELICSTTETHRPERL